MSINAAHRWRNNAEMMADVAKLWIKPTDQVYDPTYGKGNFWKVYRPPFLSYTDLDPEKTNPKLGPVDFRDMPWLDDTFDVVVFDPAYVTPGGRATSTIPKFNHDFGMDSTQMTLDDQWVDICRGLAECVRVSRGLVMQKVMNYISSATYQNYTYEVQKEMDRLGLEVVDMFHLVKDHAGPQPTDRTRKCPSCKGTGVGDDRNVLEGACAVCGGHGRVLSGQHHARNNMSTLIVAHV